MKTTTVTFCSFVMLAVTFAPAAAAEDGCAGVSAVDRCLVGVWKKTGGGAVAWMRANMPPGVSIPEHTERGGIMRFAADGTYWTAPLGNDLVVQLETPDGIERYEGQGVASAAGRWSAQDGRMHLCTDSQVFAGTVKAEGAPGPGMPVGPPGSGGPLSQDYDCSGDSLETRKSFSGIPQPMVTQYSRVGDSE